EVAFEKNRQGTLALAVEEKTPTKSAAAVSTLLATCSRYLGLRLHLETQEPDYRALQDDMASLVWLADVGEMAGPLAHEFNNFLNVVLLQLAVLEQEVPENLRQQLESVGRQGKSAAALIRQWQQYRGQRQPALRPVSLNDVVYKTVESLCR